MKKLLLIVLIFSGYLIYEQKFSRPYLGEWQADIEAYTNKNYPNGVNETQRKRIEKLILTDNISISKDKFTFKEPNADESLDYQIENKENSCYVFTFSQNRSAVGCIENNKLALTFGSRSGIGVTHYFVRSKSN